MSVAAKFTGKNLCDFRITEIFCDRNKQSSNDKKSMNLVRLNASLVHIRSVHDQFCPIKMGSILSKIERLVVQLPPMGWEVIISHYIRTVSLDGPNIYPDTDIIHL